jgi:hypothetical protein
LGFGSLVLVVLRGLIQAAEEVQKPKYKNLRPRDLRESNSDRCLAAVPWQVAQARLVA